MKRSDAELLVRLYDLMRTARMSVVYYELRLKEANRWNLVFDVSAAVVATGSGITGWAIWGTEIGKFIWAGIAAVASILAILKPILGTHRKAQQFAKSDEGWHGLFLATERLISQILIDDRVSQASERRFAGLQNRYDDLSRADEKPQRHSTRTMAQHRVNEEIPADSLRIPALTE
jgi:hypothetical protein